LQAKDSSIQTFNINMTQLNEVNITVEAKITDENKNENCQENAEEAEGFTDVLRKPIQVINTFLIN